MCTTRLPHPYMFWSPLLGVNTLGVDILFPVAYQPPPDTPTHWNTHPSFLLDTRSLYIPATGHTHPLRTYYPHPPWTDKQLWKHYLAATIKLIQNGQIHRF